LSPSDLRLRPQCNCDRPSGRVQHAIRATTSKLSLCRQQRHMRRHGSAYSYSPALNISRWLILYVKFVGYASNFHIGSMCISADLLKIQRPTCIGKSVWINQLDVTFCILYFSSNSCSTCFGQPCAHHQELTTA